MGGILLPEPDDNIIRNMIFIEEYLEFFVKVFCRVVAKIRFRGEKRTQTGSEKNLLTFNGVLPMNFRY